MATLAAAQAPASPIARTTPRWNWMVIAAASWLGFGLYWDGWAHVQGLPDSFWTIWHAAFYSGFAATAIAILTPVVLARPTAATWRTAIPSGYLAPVIGVIVFAIGGVFDATWHTLFGIETSTDALLSPSHMALGTGAALMVSGPFVSASRRAARSGLVELLPAVISLTFIFGALTFFTMFAGPYSALVGQGPRPGDTVLVRSMLGVYLFSAFVVGCALVALRRRLLPVGALTVMVGLNSIAMILMRGHQPVDLQLTFMGVAFAAGAAGDVLLWRLRPSMERLLQLRVFAIALPALYWAIYLAVVVLRVGSGWTVHELTGIVVQAGIVGLLMSFVFAGTDAPRSVAAA